MSFPCVKFELKKIQYLIIEFSFSLPFSFWEFRRSAVVEGIISAFKWETNVDIDYNHEGEEGANIMKQLETSAEPEILMAGMSSKQLSSFASYKSKLEVRESLFLD